MRAAAALPFLRCSQVGAAVPTTVVGLPMQEAFPRRRSPRGLGSGMAPAGSGARATCARVRWCCCASAGISGAARPPWWRRGAAAVWWWSGGMSRWGHAPPGCSPVLLGAPHRPLRRCWRWHGVLSLIQGPRRWLHVQPRCAAVRLRVARREEVRVGRSVWWHGGAADHGRTSVVCQAMGVQLGIGLSRRNSCRLPASGDDDGVVLSVGGVFLKSISSAWASFCF